jgi:transcriptional regulator with XRE-family HTH domain
MSQENPEIDHDAAASALYAGVGSRMKRIRTERGMTQGELGRLIGKGQSAVAQIENGQRQLSLYDAKTVCRYFGLYLNDLVGYEMAGIDFGVDPDLHHLLSATLSLPDQQRRIFKRLWNGFLDGVRDEQGNYGSRN